MDRVAKIALLLLLCLTAWVAIDAWWTPLEVRQQLAAASTTGDGYAVAEAAGFAEALCGLLRVAAPIGCLVILLVLVRFEPTLTFLVAAARGFRSILTSQQPRVLTWLLGGILAVWFLIAFTQGYGGVTQRLKDWHAYRFLPGETSLPNISANNRLVIRYVAAATPEEARIVVLSDQKLFFLSYYLLPRRLYHPLHPDSEFVIPLAHGERQLAAYTLDDLEPGYLEKIQPDYVLEYFEGPAYTESKPLDANPNWTRFFASARGGQRPDFYVNLRPYQQEGAR